MAQIFRPIRGKEADIRRTIQSSGHDGDIYFAYDTGFIYLIKDGETYTLGGSGSGGSSFVWAYAEEDAEDATTLWKVNEDDDDDVRYTMSVFAIEGSTEDNPKFPQRGLLVINSDGRFFRVTGDDAENDLITLDLIAVSGVGGGAGGGGGTTTADLSLTVGSELVDGSIFLYGQSKPLTFTASSTKDAKVSITITIYDGEHDKTTEIKESSWTSGRLYTLDAAVLPESKNITITIAITSANTSMKPAQRPKRVIPNIKVVKVGLAKFNEDAFIPLVKPDDLIGELQLSYVPYGDRDIEETLHVYVDGDEIRKDGELGYPRVISSDVFGSEDLVNIPRQSHGVHKIQLKASVQLNGEITYTDPIEFEGAWARAGEEKPIIWIGGYDPLIVNYENSYIKYMVYDPVKEANNLPATVYKYKDGIKVLESEESYSTNGWWLWDITNTYTVGSQTFAIGCRNTRVDIPITVTTAGSRNLALDKAAALLINMTAAGRSNSEIKATRSVWNDSVANRPAILTGFNWKTNGWKNDGRNAVTGIDDGTYLSLTNGASVTIPCDNVKLNYDDDYSIEMRLRIRNVQQYSTLVQSLPLYYYYEENYTPVASGTEFDPEVKYYTRTVEGEGDDAVDVYTRAQIEAFEEGVIYYTASRGEKSSEGKLMSWIIEHEKELVYDDYGSPLMDEENVQKSYKTEEGVICKWMNSNDQGLVIGSQEAYFRSPRGVINVRYKENEVINISVVISKADGLVYIYLNGILSGADALPKDDFDIFSPFTFNSNYCDIDIYRFRLFKAGLTMPNVIHNYLSDLHSIVLFDQNQLTEARTPTALEYDLLVQYNAEHPGAQTMPYAVWTIKDANREEKLPYFKGDKCKVDIEFVNPCADEALENGLIDEWTYYSGAPSYKATDVDIDVQGTSSQGYPRRNYKTKFKKAKTWVYTKGSLANQPVAAKYTVLETLDADGNPLTTPISHSLAKNFHMDNVYIGTNKFTWKIDYMESSGSYNTGFANLLGNLKYPIYTKHPLDDLNVDASGMRTSVYGFPVLTFHKYATPSNNPSKPNAVYEYIGRYNMNLDKGSNEYYGFESTAEHPYVTATRYDAVAEDAVFDNSVTYYIKNEGTYEVASITEFDPEVTYYIRVTYHPAIKDIAECWELEDNQGTWCSFKYPNAAARSTRFGTTWPDNPNRLEMMRHFEYRYSKYGDQLDAIGADGKYDGTTSDEAIIAQIGTTDAEKSEFARGVYANLERLFDWVDSTDQSAATNADLMTPFETKTEKAYTAPGETSDPVMAFNIVPEGTTFNRNETYYIKTGNDNTAASFTEVSIDAFAENTEYYTFSISYYNSRFTKDTAGYRLEKFRKELPLHFDKEYCLIYFILTELLLCYDSRGKNMMLATYGPHELDGEYIWYPIFYDIDTQLGLNNSGAYLWDYDADVTLDGLFSTPSSVLWTNMFAAFENDIKNKYRALRGVNDGTNVVNNLTYEKIAGAYECNPEVFGSWAMRGIRPIVAIGLDEYYKYFATTKTGYFDTDGNTIVEDTPEYAYACQGDKKLTTELLLRNRLNYIDSWWLGGNYQINKVKQGQFWGRVNGNRGKQTSDKYLDLPQATIDTQVVNGNAKYEGFESQPYPVKYYDSTPGFKLKPFLKQYVTFFTDEVPGAPVKYEANDDQKDGVQTFVNADTIETYKNDPESPNEQLVYIPGVDYLSSLGDLSTSYFSEFTLTAGSRLLDLTLGSDAPNYRNNLLKAGDGGKFTIADGPNSTTKKALLKKINFTGISSLKGTVDTRGSEKLEEFRALRTGLQNVYFAGGAPLHTVHLPETIESLELIEATDMKRILTSAPNVANLNGDGILAYQPADTYKGLYIKGLTDASGSGAGHVINRITIEGGGLGYDSYKLLENLVRVKTGASSNSTCAISLKDVKWSPYEQVQEGESYIATTQYYFLNDHSTFENYNDLTNPNWTLNTEDWNYKILNGKIYTYNTEYNRDPGQGTVQENTITSLQMLNNFISDYTTQSENPNSQGTQFRNTTASVSVPAITGELYVANTPETKIVEDTLTSVYKRYWPNLNIYAAYVVESYISKFVQINDSGKEEELAVNKLNPNTTTQPTIDTTLIPEKQYYDFAGWSLARDGSKMVSTFTYTDDDDHSKGGEFTNDFETYAEEMTFDEETNSIITLYAIFVPHPYKTSFDFDDGKAPRVVTTAWKATPGLNVPNVIPTKPYDVADSAMTQTGELGLYRKYKFSHWADPNDATQSRVDLTSLAPDRNRSFIAIYEDVSVYDDVLDEKYFQLNGTALRLNPEYVLEGKITIPTSIGGTTITSIAQTGFSKTGGKDNNITHIFWAREGRGLVAINQQAFAGDTDLVFFEMPETCRTIRDNAFVNCTSFMSTDTAEGAFMYDFLEPITTIGQIIFSGCISIKYLSIPGHSYTYDNNAFGGLRALKTVTFGTETEPCAQDFSTVGTNLFGGAAGLAGELNNQSGSITVWKSPSIANWDNFLDLIGINLENFPNQQFLPL